jgi:small subunit ribosomal protein S2
VRRSNCKRLFGGIADLNRLPAALFIVDIKREHIAVAEAQRLNIPTFAIVDTNSDPTLVDYAIPANDDAAKSIALITKHITDMIAEGLSERKREKDEVEKEGETKARAEKEEAEA